jgi:hypothetical protein
MKPSTRVLAIVGLMLWAGAGARAQTAVDPSGHWEGSIDLQGTQLGFEIDLVKSNGDLSGTMNIPSEHLKGLRLLKVALDGNAIGFHSRRDQPFAGSVSPDGRSISGSYSIEGFSVPFTLARTGDARLEPPVKSRPITKELAGTWSATLEAGRGMRVLLTMANHPDGTATGQVVNLDQGGLELPVVITQNASSVTLDAGPAIGGFSGVLNAERHELVGKWTQGTASIPVTFRLSPSK